MKNVTLFVILSIFILSPCAAWAQANGDSFKWWGDTLESSSLDEASTSLEGGRYQWPSLPLDDGSEDGNDWIALSKNFVVLLADHVRKNRGGNAADLVEFAKQYFSIEAALRKSGGYTNQVLGNVYATYGVYFLASALVQDSSLHDKVSKALDTRTSNTPVSVSEFLLQHLRHDPLLSGHRDDVQKIGEEVDNNLILAGMRLQELIPALGDASPPETTSGLIDAPAVPVLLSRVTLTEYASTVILPGLIQFIELGGKLDGLVRGSVNPVKDVLGDAVYNYKYELLGVRSLNSGAMMNLLEDARGEGNDKILLE